MSATDDDAYNNAFSAFIKLGTVKSRTRLEAASLQLRQVVADTVFDEATHSVMTEFTEAVVALLEAERATAREWYQDEVDREIEEKLSVVPKHRLLARYVGLHPWLYIGTIIAGMFLSGIATLAGSYAWDITHRQKQELLCQEQPDGSTILCHKTRRTEGG